MRKEPVILYFLRLLLFIVLVAGVGMLYWSSLLVEKNQRDLSQEVQQLKRTVSQLQSGFSEVRQQPHAASTIPHSATPHTAVRLHLDPNLPNLLEEDPFYTTTLPKLLGPDFKPRGTYHNAVFSKPENLHPMSNWVDVSSWYNMCVPSVAQLKFGIYETFAPDMAIKVEERKDPKTGHVEFWVHLRDDVYWQPLRPSFFPDTVVLASTFLEKHPVTAHDFKFYYDAVMNPFVQDPGAVARRTNFDDIEAVEVLDDLTFLVRWKPILIKEPDGTTVPKIKYVAKQLTGGLQPLPSFVYQYFADGTKIISDDQNPDTYRTNSVWAQNFTQHWAKNVIVSCGAWIFDGMTDRGINFKRNPDFYLPYAALAEASEFQFKDSFDAWWQDFKADHLDTYTLRPDQQLELKRFLDSPLYIAQRDKGHSIHQLQYVYKAFTYIGWNQARPFFTSSKVRRALTMSIDRARIIRQTLNGLGIEINGPFFRYSPAYNTAITPWPYDPQQAKRLLEEEGWYDSDGSGIIDKLIDGKRVKFSFALTYYSQNPTTKAICEYVSTALKEVGIECRLNGVDVADLTTLFEDKNFDALNLAWVFSAPPDDPKQIWSSAGAKQKGSSNAIGFANAEADQIITRLQFEANPETRISLYHRLGEIFHDEQPYTFLYTPKVILLYRNYVGNVFIPAERQDLIPGANVAQPDGNVFTLTVD